MARSRFKQKAPLRLTFRDREKVIGTIKGHADAYSRDPAHFQVIVLLGLGGAGKSRILDELRSQLSDTGLRLVRITLESERGGTWVAPLKSIRDRLSFQCLLFDAALISYWAASGQITQIPEQGSLSKSVVVRALETGAGAVGLSLPLSFAIDMFDRLKQRTTRWKHYRREEFEQIDHFRDAPQELLARLSHYLGLDIDRRISRTEERFVFLYDAYEKQSPTTLKDGAQWLREFIGTLERGVHVIATREPLGWPEADWKDVTRELIVDALPEEHARDLIASELAISPDMTQRIIAIAKGIPFYIEACIELLRPLAARGIALTSDDLPDTTFEATAKLIDHLDGNLHDVVRALALIQFFDKALFRILIREMNAGITVTAFDDIIDLFFVDEVAGSPSLKAVHNILSEHVRSAPSLRAWRTEALLALSSALTIRAQGASDPDALLTMFAGLIEAAKRVDRAEQACLENMTEVGYKLYDMGFWHALSGLADRSEPLLSVGDKIALLLSALSLRRTNKIVSALAQLRLLEDCKAEFGKHALSIDIEIGYLRELDGDYPHARELFNKLFIDLQPINIIERAHFRVALYRADLMIMDGRFVQGNDVLLDASEQAQQPQFDDWAELVRHRGHAHRFSLLWDEAEQIYAQALSVARGNPSLVAKLTGNIAETVCWVEPRRAIKLAHDALELNARLGNRIELAKNHVAMSLALSGIKELAAARSHATLGMNVAQEVGYRAGLAFASIAELVIGLVADNREEYCRAKDEVQRIVDKLGTYGHLAFFASALAGAAAPTAARGETFEWLEPDTLQQRVQDVLRRLGRQ